MIELLIAMTILIIGLTGIVQLQMTGLRASAYSRHATEASVLAEDKMEELRTAPLAFGGPFNDGDPVDAQGVVDPDALYTREWTVTDLGDNIADVVVEVKWLERGDVSDDHTITMQTRRAF